MTRTRERLTLGKSTRNERLRTRPLARLFVLIAGAVVAGCEGSEDPGCSPGTLPRGTTCAVDEPPLDASASDASAAEDQDADAPDVDAGQGAGPAVDAGQDAGPVVDAGQDAGPASCADELVVGCQYDAQSLHVSPRGSATGDGTRENPLRSVARALAIRGQSQTKIVVCEGVYDEQVRVSANTGALDLVGGVHCTTWRRDDSETVLRRSAPGYVLEVTEATEPVRLADLTLEAASGGAAGEHSIVAFVADSTDVEFERVELVAGAGTAGADGASQAFAVGDGEGDWPTAERLTGAKAADAQFLPWTDVVEGVSTPPVTCPGGGRSKPGTGGGSTGSSRILPTWGVSDGFPGGPRLGPSGGNISAGFGPEVPVHCVTPARTSEEGLPGAHGLGARAWGQLNGAGWQGASGQEGSPGGPGAGGGGGAGSRPRVNPDTGLTEYRYGGGGGNGGCGGHGGAPGGSGGSSIALMIWNSTVSVQASELRAGAAGMGGDGGAGQPGQEGGSGGAGSSVTTAPESCSGSKGGNGGPGGAGGGGAGGLSLGVLWSGTAPVLDDSTTITLGVGAAGGHGGMGGAEDSGGVSGRAQDVLELESLP